MQPKYFELVVLCGSSQQLCVQSICKVNGFNRISVVLPVNI